MTAFMIFSSPLVFSSLITFYLHVLFFVFKLLLSHWWGLWVLSNFFLGLWVLSNFFHSMLGQVCFSFEISLRAWPSSLSYGLSGVITECVHYSGRCLHSGWSKNPNISQNHFSANLLKIFDL